MYVGSLCLGTKSYLLTSFEEISDARSRKPTSTSIAHDKAAIWQMLKPAVFRNFREYAQRKTVKVAYGNNEQFEYIKTAKLLSGCTKLTKPDNFP
jgi:hypothetical protein